MSELSFSRSRVLSKLEFSEKALNLAAASEPNELDVLETVVLHPSSIPLADLRVH
jgi:hypothetical protein